MWVNMYMFIIAIAVLLFVLGVIYVNALFVAPAIALFIIAGYYSFNLTYITDSGSVLQLEGGEYALAFMWWGFALLGILTLIVYSLTNFRREMYAR